MLSKQAFGCTLRLLKRKIIMQVFGSATKSVGTVGSTDALAPAILKPRGRKYLFAPAIICQVYQLIDSETSNF